MYIHTVMQGETLFHIARRYGTSAVKIAENNGLGDPDRISVGQKLIILTPTRTYTVRGGDTLDGICRRFGISKRSVLQNNPYLSGRDRTYPEELLALKYDMPTHGTVAVCGYMFRGCSEERLSFAMPYINYLNIAAYKAECGRVMRLYDDVGAIRTAKEWGRLPIMRVYEPREIGDILPERDEYITRLINLARGRGYAGICLGAFKARGDEWEDVLFQLKKRMIDEGLILLSEIDANAEQKPDTVSDFCILFYEKANLYEIPTFANGERRIFEHYAKEADPTRMFMDFSPFAYADKTPISHREAYDLAYRAKREIEYEEESKICSFEYNKYLPGEKKKTRITIESPENIKAKLELVSELGYMGISFDVMRAPTSHIMTMATSCVMGVDYLSSSAEI